MRLTSYPGRSVFANANGRKGKRHRLQHFPAASSSALSSSMANSFAYARPSPPDRSAAAAAAVVQKPLAPAVTHAAPPPPVAAEWTLTPCQLSILTLARTFCAPPFEQPVVRDGALRMARRLDLEVRRGRVTWQTIRQRVTDSRLLEGRVRDACCCWTPGRVVVLKEPLKLLGASPSAMMTESMCVPLTPTRMRLAHVSPWSFRTLFRWGRATQSETRWISLRSSWFPRGRLVIRDPKACVQSVDWPLTQVLETFIHTVRPLAETPTEHILTIGALVLDYVGEYDGTPAARLVSLATPTSEEEQDDVEMITQSDVVGATAAVSSADANRAECIIL